MSVRKAVIPAAGLGTRLLPATKNVPKELLPLYDRAAIQYVVEEARQIGITDVVVIVSPDKMAIQQHFSRNFELEHHLERAGKTELLKEVQAIPDLANFEWVVQDEPLGLGHAVKLAKGVVGDEPFAVLLPDDIMVDGGALLRDMVRTYDERKSSILALKHVPDEQVCAYGIVAGNEIDEPGDSFESTLFEIKSIVEKPETAKAPSNLAVIGRYIFSPEIFDALNEINPGTGGEIQLTDAIGGLLKSRRVFGRSFVEGHLDVGNTLGWVEANVRMTLANDPAARDVIARLMQDSVGR